MCYAFCSSLNMTIIFGEFFRLVQELYGYHDTEKFRKSKELWFDSVPLHIRPADCTRWIEVVNLSATHGFGMDRYGYIFQYLKIPPKIDEMQDLRLQIEKLTNDQAVTLCIYLGFMPWMWLRPPETQWRKVTNMLLFFVCKQEIEIFIKTNVHDPPGNLVNTALIALGEASLEVLGGKIPPLDVFVSKKFIPRLNNLDNEVPMPKAPQDHTQEYFRPGYFFGSQRPSLEFLCGVPGTAPPQKDVWLDAISLREESIVLGKGVTAPVFEIFPVDHDSMVVKVQKLSSNNTSDNVVCELLIQYLLGGLRPSFFPQLVDWNVSPKPLLDVMQIVSGYVNKNSVGRSRFAAHIDTHPRTKADTAERSSDPSIQYNLITCMKKAGSKTLSDYASKHPDDFFRVGCFSSIMCQILEGLFDAQKNLHFTHRDLHSNNIMLDVSERTGFFVSNTRGVSIRFEYNRKFGVFPVSIIDFGWSCATFQDVHGIRHVVAGNSSRSVVLRSRHRQLFNPCEDTHHLGWNLTKHLFLALAKGMIRNLDPMIPNLLRKMLTVKWKDDKTTNMFEGIATGLQEIEDVCTGNSNISGHAVGDGHSSKTNQIDMLDMLGKVAESVLKICEKEKTEMRYPDFPEGSTAKSTHAKYEEVMVIALSAPFQLLQHDIFRRYETDEGITGHEGHIPTLSSEKFASYTV
jgi:serine/threonine protein kinase